MKTKLIITTAFCAALGLQSANAETNAATQIPEGLAVYGSLALVGSSTGWVDGGDDLDGLGTDDTTFEAGAEYSIGTETPFAFGAKYLQGFDFANFVSDGTTVNVKDDGGYAVYISPRMKIGDSTLLLGTLGMFKTTGKLTVNNVSGEDDLDGSYYGFGVRHYLDGKSFVEVAVERYNYKKITISSIDITGSATKGLITYGMAF